MKFHDEVQNDKRVEDKLKKADMKASKFDPKKYKKFKR